MTRLEEVSDRMVELVREADYDFDYNASTAGYENLRDWIKVELASLVQDSIHDSSIRDEAESVMAQEMDREGVTDAE